MKNVFGVGKILKLIMVNAKECVAPAGLNTNESGEKLINMLNNMFFKIFSLTLLHRSFVTMLHRYRLKFKVDITPFAENPTIDEWITIEPYVFVDIDFEDLANPIPIYQFVNYNDFYYGYSSGGSTPMFKNLVTHEDLVNTYDKVVHLSLVANTQIKILLL